MDKAGNRENNNRENVRKELLQKIQGEARQRLNTQ